MALECFWPVWKWFFSRNLNKIEKTVIIIIVIIIIIIIIINIIIIQDTSFFAFPQNK